MAVNTVDVLGNLAASTNRGPSEAIWGRFRTMEILEDPSKGYHFFDDFLMAGNLSTTNAIGNMGQWATWADTSTILGVDPQQDGGVILLSDGTNITKNITLGSTGGSTRMVSAATGFPLQNTVFFECRVAVGSITTTKRDCFIGLVDNTTTFSTASATGVINTTGNLLATVPNLFGFHFRSSTNPTDVGLAFNVAGGTVQYPTNLQTLSLTVAGAALTVYTAVTNGASTGFIKLGFVFDPNAQAAAVSSASSGQTVGVVQKKLITVYVNGQPAPAFLSSTNLQAATFPTGWMAPAISYTSRASSANGGFYVDWIRFGQLANF